MKSTNKKILVIQQYYYPDISAVSQLLSDLLQKTAENSDFKITVLCGTLVRNFEKNFLDSNSMPESHGNVKIHRISTTMPNGKIFIHRIFEFLAFFWGVFWYITLNKKKYDIFISMTSPPLIGYIVASALKHIRKPFIYYVEDLFPELFFDMGYIKRYWLISKLRFFNKKIVESADRIITLGSYMTRKFQINYDVAVDKLLEIPNWSGNISYIPPVHSNTFTILYSGNLGLAHDFSQLPLLINKLKYTDLDIEFKFVGGGRQFERVMEIFDSSGLKSSFSGYTDREEHNNILASADMLLISQKNETIGDILPSKFYSYVAAGRPMLLLGSEMSEIGSFIKNNKAGCILEIEEDVVHAIDFIDDLIRNRSKHTILCNKISKIYKEKMGIDKSVELFTSLLRGLEIER